jgi:hypothetical protein
MSVSVVSRACISTAQPNRSMFAKSTSRKALTSVTRKRNVGLVPAMCQLRQAGAGLTEPCLGALRRTTVETPYQHFDLRQCHLTLASTFSLFE